MMLLYTSSKNLFKAAALAKEIEDLEAQLQALLHEDESAAAGSGKASPVITIRLKKRVRVYIVRSFGDPKLQQQTPVAGSDQKEQPVRRQLKADKKG